MSNRLKYDQLELIKKKFKVDKLWSFSKASTYNQCSWLYYLKYVKKIRVKGDNCYTWWGTASHDLVQSMDAGESKVEDLPKLLEKKIDEYMIAVAKDEKIKFPNEDEYTHYIENIKLYFNNVAKKPYNVINEKPVLAVLEGVEKYVFQGYIDAEYVDEDGNLYIIDYKTSSMSGFSGEKLIEKATQLIIYAIGVNQHGRMIDKKMVRFPIDKIKIRYDMMKYVNITYTLKNGNEKVSKAERRLWVGHIASPIRKDLDDVEKEVEKLKKDIAKLEKKKQAKKRTDEEKVLLDKEIAGIELKIAEISQHVYDFVEKDDLMKEAIENNNLDNMPPFIKNKYKVSPCYIDIELTQELVNEIVDKVVSTLDKIIAKEKEDDKETAFSRGKIEQGESYYCTNLCDLREQCDIYKEYKEHNAMFLNQQNEAPSDDELLAMLGL